MKIKLSLMTKLRFLSTNKKVFLFFLYFSILLPIEIWTTSAFSFRDDRLLELYATHQKLCRVNETIRGQGICMFMWDCHKTGGKHLGLCSIDKSIFGSCCSMNTLIDEYGEDEPISNNVIPVDDFEKSTGNVTQGHSTSIPSITTPINNSNVIDADAVTEFPNFSTTTEETLTTEYEVPEYSEEDESLVAELEAQQHSSNLPESILNGNTCGISLRGSSSKKMRIIGGSDSHFAAWPWMVSIRRSSLFGYSSTHSCGGVILNEYWVVTAAHCVFALSKSLIRVRFGDFDFKDDQEELPFVERPIDKRIIHPDYNFTSYENDLALLKLQNPIEYSVHIRPICLPLSVNDTFVGENGTIAGWGRLSEGGIYSQKLKQVQVPIISNDYCMNLFKESGRVENIPENFICAGYAEGGKDGCQGDSGGPLQILNYAEDRWMLIGIMSWGVGCGEKNAPGVYTRITKFTEWIKQQVEL